MTAAERPTPLENEGKIKAIQIEFKYLSKTVDKIDIKVDALSDKIGGMQVKVAGLVSVITIIIQLVFHFLK